MESKNIFTESIQEVTRGTERILSESEKLIERKLRNNRRRLARYRLLVGLLGTFGFVILTNAFWLIIATVPALYTNPWILMAVGFLLLFITGSLYNRLFGR